MDPDLIKILCCPESRQPLRLAEPGLVGQLNTRIASGEQLNRAGATIHEPIQGGLLREDGKFLYPVRGGIPILLIDEALPVPW